MDQGFILHQRSRTDRRSVKVSLTEKGKTIAKIVDSLYNRHLTSIEKIGGISSDEIGQMNISLQRLERFWRDQILYRL